VLVGENRDSTRLIYAELSSKRTIKEYKGKPVGNGVIVLQEGADDCVISSMTVYNNYGSTVEPTTAHQMAIFGQANPYHRYQLRLTLGRYHHDSQFFLLNCTLTSKIIDHSIGYAYTGQVLDSCPWGPTGVHVPCKTGRRKL
jgi:hypothetical protein